MTALAALIVGLALLSLPGLLGVPTGCSIAQWTRACRSALVAGVTLVVGGLVLWGAPFLIHVLDGTGLPGFCDDVIHQLPLGGLTWATVVLAAAGIAVFRLGSGVGVAIRRARGARIDPLVGRHSCLGRYDVVVVPSTRLFAHSVPGRKPQIVLSDGLVDLLDHGEVAAVVRHEIAHHRLVHRRYLVLAATIDHLLGWIPSIRRSTDALRSQVEVWADHASTGSPRKVRDLTSALRRIGEADLTTPVRRAVGWRISMLRDGRDDSRPSRAATPAVAIAGAAGVAATLALGAAGFLEFWSAVGRCSV